MAAEVRQVADAIGAILRGVMSEPQSDAVESIGSKFGYQPSYLNFESAPPSTSGIVAPVGEISVNSPYGPRGKGFHGGVDLKASSGTAVLAANSGIVTHSANDDPGGYGLWVEITGDDGVVTRYGHLSASKVQQGTRVNAGALIGASGGTPGAYGSGNSEGDHLHFEVRQGGQAVDPLPFLGKSGQILSDAPVQMDESMATMEMVPGSPNEVLAAQVTNITDAVQGKTATADPMKMQVKPGQKPGDPLSPTAVKGKVSIEGGGDLDQWIRTAMMIKGVDESWYEGIYHRAIVESGGQNIIQSPSTVDVNTGGNEAFGPWQFVQGTFNRFAEPGYEDWHNPLHQALAVINAVQQSSKYGGHPSGLPRSGGWSP